ncbi:hypothetical protein BD779DRAFT_1523749 [Infundibulicybe gibba]|nr:hypothetical protein BD779DRAFT_1523749 [Infundibulicybe gibba]
MAGQYTGSKFSPIVIEDSDEEVIHQLCDELPDTPPPSRSPHPSTTRFAHNHSNMGTVDTRDGYPPNSHGSVKIEDNHSNKLNRKRKRSEPGPPYFVAPASGPNPMRKLKTNVPESKKARKRRRKLEREALAEHQQLPYDEGTALSLQTPSSQQWPMINSAIHRGVPDPRAYQHMHSPPSGLGAAMPTQYRPQPLVYSSGPYDIPAASTSSWVARMALAAESPEPPPPREYIEPVEQRFPPVQRAVPATDVGSSTGHKPRSARSHFSTVVPTPPVHLPIKPRESIGMRPEQDPFGKHGFFDTSPSSLNRCFTSTPYRPKNYSPNPARTLVMDQSAFPKPLRTLDYVKTWCTIACGAQPVYIAVDTAAGKALIEFATVDLARKAWSSPKLDPSSAGIREDLIKVWWYRAHHIETEVAAREIEEGEIEDDGAKKPPSAPPRKETKKERKARLARERLAIRSNVEGKPNTRSAVPPKPPKQLGPPMPVPTIGIQPMPPTVYPYSLPRPTLPPLEQNLASTSYRSSYGSSLRPADSATQEDRESIASSRGSPPRPHSPPGPPPNSKTQEVFVDPIQDSEDMDIEVDNVEPRPPEDSSRDPGPPIGGYPFDPHLISPNLPLNAPIPRFGQFPTSAPSQPPPQPVPPPAPNSTLPTPAPTPPQGATSHTTPAQPSPLLDVIPPVVETVISPVPSPAPSEPRAMKNVPKGPSFAKRSLLARQKELEEIILKTKIQLGPNPHQAIPSRVSSPSPSDSIPGGSIDTLPTSEINGAADMSDKQAMEGRLRKLVLESQRTKHKAPVSDETVSSVVCPPDVASPPNTISSDGKLSPPPTTPIVLPPPTDPPKISLDDLAVSFITETIQTITSKSPPAALLQEIQVTKPRTSNATIKVELAAKQRQLEQQIADSKILMAKLAMARTKQEKNSILAAMREKTRVAEDHQNPSSSADTHRSNQQNEYFVGPVDSGLSGQRRWPDCDHSSGVFIMISDDESGDSDGE